MTDEEMDRMIVESCKASGVPVVPTNEAALRRIFTTLASSKKKGAAA